MSATTRLPLLELDQWTLSAACRGMSDVFFPPDYLESKMERRRREAKAKSICLTCSVRLECLSRAVEDGERFGIWGGMTERERRSAFSRLRRNSPQDIAGPGRPVRLPAAVVQGRAMSPRDT